jgi:GNAT superfamily N-acetyltransferase
MTLTVRQVTLDDRDGLALIAALDADLWERYPEDQAVYAGGNRLPAGTTLFVAYLDNVAVGCGAFKPFDSQTVEIKRMYTRPDARGQGVAAAILAALEALARAAGHTMAVLETGSRQVAAMHLYHKLGYRRRDCFGMYADMPLSLCYEKSLV